MAKAKVRSAAPASVRSRASRRVAIMTGAPRRAPLIIENGIVGWRTTHTFPAVYGNVATKRFTDITGQTWRVHCSYSATTAGSVRLFKRLSPGVYEATPSQTLDVSRPRGVDVITIPGVATFMFVASNINNAGTGTGNGSTYYDTASKIFYRLAIHTGFNDFQTINGFGAVLPKFFVDGSTTYATLANSVSSTRNTLPGGTQNLANCYRQSIDVLTYTNLALGFERFQEITNLNGPYAGPMFKSQLGLGIGSASYYNDLGTGASAPGYQCEAHVMLYKSSVTKFGTKDAAEWKFFVKGAGDMAFFVTNPGHPTLENTYVVTTSQRDMTTDYVYNEAGQLIADPDDDVDHFSNPVHIRRLNVKGQPSVIDPTAQVVCSLNNDNGVKVEVQTLSSGQILISFSNSNTGGGGLPGNVGNAFFNEGHVTGYLWNVDQERAVHAFRVPARGPHCHDIYEDDGRIFMGVSEFAEDDNARAELHNYTTTTREFEIGALTFRGADGANGTNGTNGTNGANGAPGAPVWNFESSTTMAAPATGGFRLNSATLSAVNAIALSAQSGDSGNPSLLAFLNAWDDSTNTVRGHLLLRNISSPGAYAVYSITGNVTDNTTWAQITLTHVTSSGTFSAGNAVAVKFSRAGDRGATGAAGASVASSVTFTPTGGVAATNVQAAIAEVDAEKLALTGGTLTGALNGTTVSMTGNIQTSAGDVTGLAFNSSVTGTAEQYTMVARRSGVVRGYLAFTDTNIFRIYHYSSAGAYLSIPFETYGDGSCRFFGPARLQSYSRTSLPSASTYPGAQIYVSDATGGACVAFSNGTNWLRCDTSAIVS